MGAWNIGTNRGEISVTREVDDMVGVVHNPPTFAWSGRGGVPPGRGRILAAGSFVGAGATAALVLRVADALCWEETAMIRRTGGWELRAFPPSAI